LVSAALPVITPDWYFLLEFHRTFCLQILDMPVGENLAALKSALD
jgi:hypothetical protein